MHRVLVVVSNFPADFDVTALLRSLLECRLVACGNILPAVQSLYRWDGAIESAVESTLVLKTTADRYPAVDAALLAAHPYDVPEILALPVRGGLPAYLAWVQQENRKDVDVKKRVRIYDRLGFEERAAAAAIGCHAPCLAPWACCTGRRRLSGPGGRFRILGGHG